LRDFFAKKSLKKKTDKSKFRVGWNLVIFKDENTGLGDYFTA